ncbi:MAG: hypothetical protein QCI38_07850, partial [Candidatus Thermoplasmatota archaeon]|nr:hypothetical protein [Candidatus Thermoplasmatota archaeon]
DMTTGTWTGTWQITAHANPITTIGGRIGDTTFETYIIEPNITNDTGGTYYQTGTPTTFNMSITHNNGPASLYTNYTTLIYDKWGNRLARLEWHTTRTLRTASDPLVYAQPVEPPAPTYTFTNPGLYDVYIVPKDNYDHTLQWQYAAYQELVVTGEPTPTTPPTGTGNTIVYAGFCLLFILLAKTVLIVYYITDYKKHKDTYHRGDKK